MPSALVEQNNVIMSCPRTGRNCSTRRSAELCVPLLLFFFLKRKQAETSQRKSATSAAGIDTALCLKCSSFLKSQKIPLAFAETSQHKAGTDCHHHLITTKSWSVIHMLKCCKPSGKTRILTIGGKWLLRTWVRFIPPRGWKSRKDSKQHLPPCHSLGMVCKGHVHCSSSWGLC